MKDYRRLLKDIAKGDKNAAPSIVNLVKLALLSCRFDQVGATVKDITTLLNLNRARLVCPLFEAPAKKLEGQVSPGHVYEAARRVLEIAASDWANQSVEQMIDQALAEAIQADKDAWAEVFRTSDAAIEAGVDFGDVNADNRLALEESREKQESEALANAAAVLAQSNLPADKRDDDSQRAQSLKHWSVKRLLEWFNESPLDGRQVRRLDRAKAIEREQQAAKDRAARRKAKLASLAKKPQPRRRVEESSSDDEAGSSQDADSGDDAQRTGEMVDGVNHAAYLAALEFYAVELRDMVALGKALKADPEAIECCDRLAAQMGELMATLDGAPARFDEAQGLFGKAGQALNDLRRVIKGAQADARLQKKFDTCLWFTLSQETLELPRAIGGRIECPLTPQDWFWVSKRYHGRLLRQRYLNQGDRRVALASDERLVLYVTYKSLSGYVFDISVHLWRGFPETKEPPGLPAKTQGELEIANERWGYDTRLPCTVMHVPLAAPRRRSRAH